MITEEHINHARGCGWSDQTIMYWKEWLSVHNAQELLPADFEAFIRRQELTVAEAVGDAILPSWRKPKMTSAEFIESFVEANPDMPEEHQQYFDQVLEDLGDLKRDLDNTFLAARRVTDHAEELSAHALRMSANKGTREKTSALLNAIREFAIHKDAVT